MISLFFEFTREAVIRNVNDNKRILRLGKSTLTNGNISTKNKMFPNSLATKKPVQKNSIDNKQQYIKTLNNVSSRYTP